MATITGLTATRMLAIEAASIVNASLVADHLVLVKHDGTTIDVGSVRGPQGTPYANGVDTVNNQTVGGLKTLTQKLTITRATAGTSLNITKEATSMAAANASVIIGRTTPATDSQTVVFANGVTQSLVIGRQANLDHLSIGVDSGSGFTEKVRLDTAGNVLALGNANKFGRGALGGTGVSVSLSEDTVNTFISPTGTPADIDLIFRPKGTSTGAVRIQNSAGTVNALVADKNNHILLNGAAAPTVGSLGTNVTAGSATGCDASHTVSLTFNGSAPGTPLCHVTFNVAYAAAPHVLCGFGQVSGQFLQVFAGNITTTGYDIILAVAATPSNGAVLKFSAHVFGN